MPDNLEDKYHTVHLNLWYLTETMEADYIFEMTFSNDKCVKEPQYPFWREHNPPSLCMQAIYTTTVSFSHALALSSCSLPLAYLCTLLFLLLSCMQIEPEYYITSMIHTDRCIQVHWTYCIFFMNQNHLGRASTYGSISLRVCV